MTTILRRVLIVEDSNLQAKVCQVLFQRHAGWQTVIAKDGIDALDKLNWEKDFRNNDFDIVLLDMNMPRMDGLSFLKAMKDAGYGHIPVLVVSTEGEDAKIREALKAGARGYVKKPWQPDQVWNMIDKLVPPNR